MSKSIIIAALTLLLTAVPAHAQDAFLAFVCQDRGHVEALAGEMTDRNVQQSDPRWFTCRPIGVGIEDMSDAPAPFMGPLDDWEGDTFAVYEQGGVFLIVYWINGYSPTSAEL